ncbi:group II intron reverse transcriptase/maturase [Candidatus Wolbachia massiliensis]|uniref:group II intron reverse transcriptase/maturase n=1 Tax=Candidatus Wolbachia massiliensis TaxID=1845000 RepID=UPI001CD06C17|nr:group II intron reverse transcriptase/maturase [Candidatus Wolbachia massiliensis]
MNNNEYVIDQRNVRYKWNTIPWRKLERFVFKLQKRIYQAVKCNDIVKVHKLQRLLLNSMSAKLLAVRKVTQDNRGKKTAGIDGKANLNQEERLQLAYSLDVKEKAKPSRRIWIPKPKKTEKRPIGIPTISERAKETLMKMALEPEWEAKFEPNIYGFRPGRSCHDAIEAIFDTLKMKTAYILDADISGCFDNIDHSALLKKLNTTPTIKKIIRGWLRAGVMENGKFQSTKRGTIQGGTISPLLACVALHGLEQHVKEALTSELFQHMKRKYGNISHNKAKKSISVIFYGDDFIVVHENEEIILKAKILVEEWLKAIGLELKPSKTKVSHTLKAINRIKPGFDFLGFSVRHYRTKESKKGYKLLIKPSCKSIKQHGITVKHKLRGLRGATQEAVIKELNPIIRGWSQYYLSVVASKTFNSMGKVMFRKLWKWAVFRHPTKNRGWIRRKYFKKYGNDNWRFMTNNKMYLIKHGDHAIKRHVKVKRTKSPYDGDWVYWGNRLKKIPDKSPRVIKLLKLQQGKCGHCQLWFKNDDILEIHHIDQNRRNNMNKNLSLLHGHCHDELHMRCA